MLTRAVDLQSLCSFHYTQKPLELMLFVETSFTSLLVTDYEHLELTAQRILGVLSLESVDISTQGVQMSPSNGPPDTILRLIKPVKGSREEWMWAT